MAQLLQVRHKGLYTNPNEFSSVPEGALLRAANCIITRDNVIEPRRGFNRVASIADGNARIGRIAFYQDQTLAAWTGGNIGYKNGTTFTALSGTYGNPDDNLARTRFLLAESNAYFTSDGGVYRLDAYNATPALAGVPKALDISLALSGASGFLANNNQLAYRIVWGIRDANNTLRLGAPSGRAVVTNTSGGTRDVSVTTTIPADITTAFFFQVYRSKASGGSAIEPDDELGLVYEANPTAGEILAGTLTFTDQTPDDLRGASLYTNPSEEGIAQANDRPPLCEDIEEFSNCIFYANTESLHRLSITIVAVGGSAGIQLNDTLTIGGVVYTAKASETIASGEYALVTGGTPAQNIADTTQSLIRVINRYASSTVYAYYLSGPDDLPGKILLERRTFAGGSFTAQASANGGAFNPSLASAESSSNDDFQNALMISKSEKGEAVPLINIRRVGSANNPIRRIKKLRNSLFVFKDREGIFRVTGTDPTNFQVDLFDSSAKLIAPDTLAVVNNQIWGLFDQGITTVSETGVSVVSRPIEDLILDQFGLALNAVRYYSFGAGYETDRQYALFTVSASGDTVPTQVFVFNVFTQAYTRWEFSKTAAAVSPVNDRMYLGSGTSSFIEEERKDRQYTDYVDYGVAYTITSASGTQVFLTSTNEIEVGDILYQAADVQSVVQEIASTYVTVADDLGTWTAGSATILKAYEVEVEYAPLGGNPGMLHHFPEVAWLFRVARFEEATASFATDASAFYEDVPLAGNRTASWGLFPWAEESWGGTDIFTAKRTYVPLEKQRGALLRVRFRIREGQAYFRLEGLSIPMRDTGSTVVTT